MSKFFAWFRKRPSESWLGGWLIIVSVVAAPPFSINLDGRLVMGIGALINWLITGYASRPDNNWGPEVSLPSEKE